MSSTPGEQGVHQLDGGALGCARLLLLLRDFAAGLPDEAVIHLTTTDPVAPIDLPAWCRLTGHTYLGAVPGPGRPTYAVQITATPLPTRTDAPWKVVR
ncbi:sulfurtransferase tusA (plasmid) [Cellulomonas sp. WB94]|uniref:sulfurtransferase TusA family protein n=1 Tax=Cellulomonas sp. WB94 TaxID=2173174 RepID=UPI000D56D1E8|nr:sulfurtransferase tusA [Cellulomonas sp. WB94]PVU81390.1 sulfurtransferase tusA [Cellulomonas sp. WB94]